MVVAVVRTKNAITLNRMSDISALAVRRNSSEDARPSQSVPVFAPVDGAKMAAPAAH
jgi:hypothetical protein